MNVKNNELYIYVYIFSALLQKDDMATMDRSFLQRNTELVADVVEAFLQRVSHIVLIENTASSAKVRKRN